MRNLFFLLFGVGLTLLFSSCERDPKIINNPFVVAFAHESIYFGGIQDQVTVQLVFSEVATRDGGVTIRVKATNAANNVDFALEPALENQEFTLPIKSGTKSSSFVFKNLIYPLDRSDKAVLFEIVNVDYQSPVAIQGFKNLYISFDSSIGGVLMPPIGGPNQPFQVYVDLSSGDMQPVKRDSWDLGFYCGADQRVVLNGAVYMAAKRLDLYDIDAVTESQVSSFFSAVAMGTFDPANVNYIDSPKGNLSETAIDEIDAKDSNNSVYLLNLGDEVGTNTVSSGVAISGKKRGWKKIRVLKRGEDYLLQYANLDDKTHQEVLIAKNQAYNFKFFSLQAHREVAVEPLKKHWDLNFTVFTNIIEGSGSYGFSDFVTNNIHAGVQLYHVTIPGEDPKKLIELRDQAFADFALTNLDPSKFSSDQTVIGAEWRDVFTGNTTPNVFYILKDAKGNHYKIKMLAFLNEIGQRGYPKFEYKIVK